MKLLFFLALFAYANAAKELKIYIFKVQSADSQLIVFPSGYSILIDVGERGSNAKYTKYVAKRVESILGKKKVDVLVMTHYHVDHIGTYGSSGIWYLLEKKGFKFGKYLKRNAGTFKGSSMSKCSKSSITWKYVGKISSSAAKFVCYGTATKFSTKLNKIAENAHRCNNKQINPPDAGAKVTTLIRDALGVKSTSSGKKLYRNSMNSKPPVGENDFSVCIRLQYGEFVYATCGDLSGYTYTFSDKTYRYHDVESSVAKMMGSVDLLKVNHHGSKSATNTKWANTLKPTVAVVTCGSTSSHPHTRPLKNLKAAGTKMIYTTGADCAKSNINKYKSIVTQMGDDVVISVGQNAKTFKVTNSKGGKAKTYNIKLNKPAPAACKKLE